jgi:Mg-chelatase subunit ChlD
VKRDAHQFRPLGWFVIFLSFFLILVFSVVPAVAQSPSGPDGDPAGKGDEKPKEEAKTKDAAKSKEDVKKDTQGFAVKPLTGLHMDVDLALINVTVTDPYNRLVTGLDPDNFRVYEDNIEQEVVTFSSEDVPISIGVIFDFSGSMANKISKAREAALQFFKTANPQDEFFLVSFNERAELTSAFTNSIEDLQSRMMLTAPNGAARCDLSRSEPDEGCQERQARLAHPVGWRG